MNLLIHEASFRMAALQLSMAEVPLLLETEKIAQLLGYNG